MTTLRPIRDLIKPQMVIEGAGVRLLRSFGPSTENRFDPFLLFDHFAFNDPVEGPIAGFPQHPHRGIETVTTMLAGSVHHRDSLGNQGLIGPGDVQWMTSGRGILHEEMPRRDEEGRVAGFQLWVNLPAVEKMSAPRYQEIPAAQIPVLQREGTRIRVITGRIGDVSGPARDIAAQPLYLDVALAPGARFCQNLPREHTAAAYLFEGRLAGLPGEVDPPLLLTFGPGERLELQNTSSETARFMLMAGAPFREPIAPYGPFVMNTREEILQALADLKNGTFVR